MDVRAIEDAYWRFLGAGVCGRQTSEGAERSSVARCYADARRRSVFEMAFEERAPGFGVLSFVPWTPALGAWGGVGVVAKVVAAIVAEVAVGFAQAADEKAAVPY